MAPNDTFAQVVLFTAQHGFARNVAAATGTCRAVWEDERLWEILVKLPARCEVSVLAASISSSGDGSRTRWLLDLGADINMRGTTGRTALHAACSAGHDLIYTKELSRIRKLLVLGSSNAKAITEPLSSAALLSINSTVAFLLNRGAAVDATDADGLTPLHIACLFGREELALTLINASAEIDTRAPARLFVGCTPLHFATWRGMATVVTALLDRGADIHSLTEAVCDTAGWQAGMKEPLHYACACGHEGVARLLIERGASISVEDEEGLTPFLYACAKPGLESLVDALLERGADACEVSRAGVTPLHCAGGSHVVQALLSRGAIVDAECRALGTPLIHASQRGKSQAALSLIANGANVLAVDTPFKRTALHYACGLGQTELAIVMLEHGALVAARCFYNGSTPLHHACKGGHTTTVQALIERGADAMARDYLGDTAMHYAALSRQDITSLVTCLLGRGVSVNASGFRLRKPLHRSCNVGSVSSADVLLQFGADINARDNKQQAPLHIASQDGPIALVRTLLYHGALVNAEADDGRTPLHYACEDGRVAAAALLVQRGADVTAQDVGGSTPLELARLISQNADDDEGDDIVSQLEALLATPAQ